MVELKDLENIKNAFCGNKLSHAFLVETNDFEKCLSDLKNIIKMIICEEKYMDNCSKCNLCYQIEKETLPSFIIVKPDGSSIKKEQIIELKEQMSTKPIYSKYNIYIVLNSEKLTNSSANTMLKFIEEPEENIIGFFITNNKENIIETIRSRCHLLRQYYNELECKLDDEKLVLIDDFIKNIELDNKHVLLYIKNIFLEKKYTREEIIKIFLEIFKIYDNIYQKTDETLLNKYNFLASQNNLKLANKLKIINKTIDNLSKNGNINLILDSFAIEMR